MALRFLGRLMFVTLFLLNGLEKLASFEPATGGPAGAKLAPKLDDFFATVHSATGVHLPITKSVYPNIVLAAAAAEIVGGFLFLLNLRIGSLTLLAFMVPTTLIMHNFWAHNQQVNSEESLQFFKQLAIIGALVMHLGGQGKASRTSRFRAKTE